MIYSNGIGGWSGGVLLGKRGIRQSAATYMYYYDSYFPGCDSQMALATTPATTPAPEIPHENHLNNSSSINIKHHILVHFNIKLFS